MRLNFLAIFLLVLVFQSSAQQTYNILNFGAVADGKTNNTIAIQNAINAAANVGGATVIIPKGNFVTGTIRLISNVELNLQKGALLLGSTDRLDYGGGTAEALIVANNQSHIAITGKGSIDGRGMEVVKNLILQLQNGTLVDKQFRTKAPEEKNRPKIFSFIDCKDVKITGITLKNSASWVQEYRFCDGVLIDRVTVLSNEYWNNDGIDINNSKNVTITNCYINVSDDAICIKSEGEIVGTCENIYIANCTLRSSANAFKIGTGSRGGFKNIKVRNLKIFDTYRSAIAIETVDGAFLENIDVKNVKAINTGSAILIRLGHRNADANFSSAKNISIANVNVEIPIGKPDKGYPMEGPGLKYPPGIKPVKGQITSVSPWNNSSKDSTAIPYPHNVFPSSITGLPGHLVQNVKLENVKVKYYTIADSTVNHIPLAFFNKITEAEKDYPEFSMFGEVPVWGFYIRHVNGITLKNVSVKMKGKDFRTAFLFDDVKELVLQNIKSYGVHEKQHVFYNNVIKALGSN